MTRKGGILVVGADGLIGRALSDYLANQKETVYETTRQMETISERRSFLDLSQDVSMWQPPCQVSVAYLCAAITSLAHCQQHPTQSTSVNVTHTVALAKALAKQGTFVIFPSTNLVYDGAIPFRESDQPICPLTEYGRQKAEAEKQLLKFGDMASIVRFTKVIAPNMPLFRGWIQALKQHKPIHPFSDLVMAPVPLSSAIDVLYHIAKHRLSGILQISGKQDITYAQAARYIAQRIGANPKLVQPITSSEAGVSFEAIPLHTTLDTSRIRRELGKELPDVWSAIDTVLDS